MPATMLADLFNELTRRDTAGQQQRLQRLGFEYKGQQGVTQDKPHAQHDGEPIQQVVRRSGVDTQTGHFQFPLVALDRQTRADDEPPALGSLSALADDELDLPAPYVRPATIGNRQEIYRALSRCLQTERSGGRLDIAALTARVARHQPLETLPRLSQHAGRSLSLVLIDECAPLWGDIQTLIGWLHAAPSSLKPSRIVRLRRGMIWPAADETPPVRGCTLIVGQRSNPSPELASALSACNTALIWCDTREQQSVLRWDDLPRYPRVEQPVQWLLALLAPLPVIDKALLRRLRRRLGAGLDTEIDFWGRREVQYDPAHEFGYVESAHRETLLQQLISWQNARPAVFDACYQIIAQWCRDREQIYWAEASLNYRRLRRSWSGDETREFERLDQLIAMMSKRCADDDIERGIAAAQCVIGLLSRLGHTAPLSPPVAAAAEHVQDFWRQHGTGQLALVGDNPQKGLAPGFQSVALMAQSGNKLCLRSTDTQGVALAKLETPPEGAVLEHGWQRQLLSLDEPFPTSDSRLYCCDGNIDLRVLDSAQLWWADSFHQGDRGLVIEASGHTIALGPADALAPLWLGDAIPQIDRIGLFVDQPLAGVVQRFRYCPPGRLWMGSPENEPERRDDERLHEVALSQGFWMADTVVTQRLWQAVTGNNPAAFTQDQDNPVERISWDQASEFCIELNKEMPIPCFTLPTEAQWEYACRAGSATVFSWGDSLMPDQARFNWSHPYRSGPGKERPNGTVLVKSFTMNSWGLYQMHGNVWEWCRDGYYDYPQGLVRDPVGITDRRRVLRGGGWVDDGRDLRAAQRLHFDPDSRDNFIGCRLCQPVPETDEPTGEIRSTSQRDASPPAGGGPASRSGVRGLLDKLFDRQKRESS